MLNGPIDNMSTGINSMLFFLLLWELMMLVGTTTKLRSPRRMLLDNNS